ncbi:MAG: hypothetical protein KDE45_17035 [Caldilineaceae bacterium]|nr:hypothetical protein [Caldilineaceae bacterium]
MVRLNRKDCGYWLPLLLLLLLFPMGCQSAALSQVTANLEVEAAAVEGPTDLTSPVAAEEAEPPVALQIAELGLALDVVPMGWVVTDVNGQTTTEWIIPTEAAGWHVNSAKAGAAGNLILSGHQIVGDAAFAPIFTFSVV